jgi:hypothetical protein
MSLADSVSISATEAGTEAGARAGVGGKEENIDPYPYLPRERDLELGLRLGERDLERDLRLGERDLERDLRLCLLRDRSLLSRLLVSSEAPKNPSLNAFSGAADPPVGIVGIVVTASGTDPTGRERSLE